MINHLPWIERARLTELIHNDTDGQTVRQTDTLTDDRWQTEGQTVRQPNRQTETNDQTYRQTDRQKNRDKK